MTPSRRTLLGGLLATLAAPAIIRTPGLLMPVRVVRPMFTLDDWVSRAGGYIDWNPSGFVDRRLFSDPMAGWHVIPASGHIA